MNAVFEVVENALLIVHGRDDPSNEEWKALVQRLAPHVHSVDQVVVITLGGLWDSYQRRLIQPLLERIDRRIVVTSSPAVRGVVTALSWMGLTLETAPLSRLRDAFESLGVPQSRVLRLLQATEALLQKVDPVGMEVLPIGGLKRHH